MPWCPAARCTQLHVSCEPAFRNHAECTYRYVGVLNAMRNKYTWFARKVCSLHSTLCNPTFLMLSSSTGMAGPPQSCHAVAAVKPWAEIRRSVVCLAPQRPGETWVWRPQQQSCTHEFITSP